MRPAALEDFVGQGHLLAEGSALRAAIEQGRPHSMILYGPPGQREDDARADRRGADARAAFEEAQRRRGRARRGARRDRARRAPARTTGEPTIFFLDEIHRFNKAQQDALLPAVEEGLVTLIGATTENPYFEVNSALLSRTQVYELHALTAGGRAGAAAARAGARRVRRGEVGDEVLEFLAARAGGDARAALAALELACETAGDGPVTLEHAEDALQRKALRYDKDADQHYDYISAWIKATRGSDPDASLYYLAVMLEGGEDPRFIARRMVILASEDVGNADPQALGGRRRRGPRRRARRAAGVPVRAGPGRDLPVARAEVRRRQARDRRRARARARPRRRAAARLPALGRLPRRRQARPRRGLRLPPPPGTGLSRRTCCRPTWREAASTSPATPRRSWRERLEEIRRARGRDV